MVDSFNGDFHFQECAGLREAALQLARRRDALGREVKDRRDFGKRERGPPKHGAEALGGRRPGGHGL